MTQEQAQLTVAHMFWGQPPARTIFLLDATLWEMVSMATGKEHVGESHYPKLVEWAEKNGGFVQMEDDLEDWLSK